MGLDSPENSVILAIMVDKHLGDFLYLGTH